jgi:S-formylglutathione hydrolase FrmB
MGRRGLLLGGAVGVGGFAGAGALVEGDHLPGRTRAYQLLGLNGADGVVPDVPTGPVRTGVLDSSRVADPPGWSVAYPPGSALGDPLPVVVALHGARSSAARLMSDLALPAYLAASGERLAVAAVDGGASSYWHPRADGGDPAAMVLDEFLPMLSGLGLSTRRPGLIGWSMGGLGVLYLSGVLGERGRAQGPVLAVSPALAASYDSAARAAYDDLEDWEEVLGRVDAALGGDLAEVRVDCGRGDPFFHAVTELALGPGAETHVQAGDHTAGYWTRVLPDQLAWMGARVGGS